MAKVPTETGFRRKDASPVYFQFPLPLLTIAEDPKELVQYLVDYALVSKGLPLVESYDSGWIHELVERAKEEGPSCPVGYVLRNVNWKTYDSTNRLHLAFVAALASRDEGGLDMGRGALLGAFGTGRYERARAHIERYEELVPGSSKHEVRIASDIMWGHLNTGSMSVRRFRVLAAVYGLIGSSKTPQAFKRERIAAAAAGFYTEGMLAQAAEKLGAPEPVGEKPPKAARLDASGLPGAVCDFGGKVKRPSSWTASYNLFRYDNARAFWLANGPRDVPFTKETADEGDAPPMFEASFTDTGVLFKLRPEYLQAVIERDEGKILTGPVDPAEHFEPGMKVLFFEPYDRTVQRGMPSGAFVRGTVVYAALDGFKVEGEDGEAVRIARKHNAPCPLDFLPPMPELPAVDVNRMSKPSSEDSLSLDVLTVEQVKYTLDKLEALGWFARLRDRNRSFFYSNRHSKEEIAGYLSRRLEKREKNKHERELAELKVKVEATKAKTRRHAEKAALEAELAEARRELEAAEARRAALAASKSVPSAVPPAAPPMRPLTVPPSVPPLIESAALESKSLKNRFSESASSTRRRSGARADDEGERRELESSTEEDGPTGEGGHVGKDDYDAPALGAASSPSPVDPTLLSLHEAAAALFGPPALRRVKPPPAPSPSETAEDGEDADPFEAALAEAARIEAEAARAGEAAGGVDAQKEQPARGRPPQSGPPPGGLTAYEAVQHAASLGDPDSLPLIGEGGRFEQVRTEDGQNWYLERPEAIIQRERAALGVNRGAA